MIRLTESVIVPSTPTIKAPADYKVPHPENLVSRHPIYGRIHTSENIDEDSKAASKRKMLVTEVKLEDGEVPHKKKKKKDKKNDETNTYIVKEDTEAPPKKKKSKKSKE